MPLVSALDRGKSNVAIEGVDAIRRVGPGDSGGEIANDFPVGKEYLGLVRVGELQGAQKKTPGFEWRDHGIEMIARGANLGSERTEANPRQNRAHHKGSGRGLELFGYYSTNSRQPPTSPDFNSQ